MFVDKAPRSSLERRVVTSISRDARMCDIIKLYYRLTALVWPLLDVVKKDKIILSFFLLYEPYTGSSPYL